MTTYSRVPWVYDRPVCISFLVGGWICSCSYIHKFAGGSGCSESIWGGLDSDIPGAASQIDYSRMSSSRPIQCLIENIIIIIVICHTTILLRGKSSLYLNFLVHMYLIPSGIKETCFDFLSMCILVCILNRKIFLRCAIDLQSELCMYLVSCRFSSRRTI